MSLNSQGYILILRVYVKRIFIIPSIHNPPTILPLCAAACQLSLAGTSITHLPLPLDLLIMLECCDFLLLLLFSVRYPSNIFSYATHAAFNFAIISCFIFVFIYLCIYSLFVVFSKFS